MSLERYGERARAVSLSLSHLRALSVGRRSSNKRCATALGLPPLLHLCRPAALSAAILVDSRRRSQLHRPVLALALQPGRGLSHLAPPIGPADEDDERGGVQQLARTHAQHHPARAPASCEGEGASEGKADGVVARDDDRHAEPLPATSLEHAGAANLRRIGEDVDREREKERADERDNLLVLCEETADPAPQEQQQQPGGCAKADAERAARRRRASGACGTCLGHVMDVSWPVVAAHQAPSWSARPRAAPTRVAPATDAPSGSMKATALTDW
mmetsp:Transcript_19534/g.64584  ORF Transcript_19534/g.64584 Transcript_19534/m.64584 type:complete len:273 (+) Transcript_19534:83-901(+)